MTHLHSPWTGMVPVDDTALFTNDTGGPGTPVVYLNGAYADLRHWDSVVADLGTADWRHVRFDERARGRSRRSVDYSFEACLRDIEVVLDAADVERPVLAGWSYGATLAVHWARRHPDRTLGVVAVDGAMPYDWIDDEARARLRRLFHRMRWILPVASRMGLAARMSAAQHAEVNIEVNELLGTLESVLDSIEAPVRYVVATGGHLGTDDAEMAKVRATLEPVLDRRPNIRVSATVPTNHARILRREFDAVADAVREVGRPAGPGDG
ncbi:alpha/beta fold hydrolase [Georgenia sp. Z1344]|uniref:alpha/beta fold hydrolase n=1 Tax=Georgenia sp. Z1344 TaxID=3416706 RepID=UPI003CE6FA75